MFALGKLCSSVSKMDGSRAFYAMSMVSISCLMQRNGRSAAGSVRVLMHGLRMFSNI